MRIARTQSAPRLVPPPPRPPVTADYGFADEFRDDSRPVADCFLRAVQREVWQIVWPTRNQLVERVLGAALAIAATSVAMRLTESFFAWSLVQLAR